MLKFSGFSDLTSCLEVNSQRREENDGPTTAATTVNTLRAYPQLLLKMTHRLYASKSKDLDTHRLARPSRQRRARCLEEKKVDTEAGMLSGISRKRSMRSRSYWFTEFCNSQCLSHFAAPFIVVRAETSIAESCN